MPKDAAVCAGHELAGSSLLLVAFRCVSQFVHKQHKFVKGVRDSYRLVEGSFSSGARLVKAMHIL